MYTFILFLHVAGAVGMGIYVVLPIIAGRFRRLSTPAQEGLASGLISAGRFGQFALVVQLLTGGYLMSQGDYSTSWIIAMGIVYLAIGALTGLVARPLKQIVATTSNGQSATDAIARVRVFSILIVILFLVMLYMMTARW
jgi:hypothetical protein